MIKEVIAKTIPDSRKERTIKVIVKTQNGKFKASSPAGKSTGEYEVKSYAESLDEDIEFINKLNIDIINKILYKYSGVDKQIGPREVFSVLKDLESSIGKKIGGNSLFALEASLLKALAYEKGKELYEFMGKNYKIPRPVGNTIGGGVHSIGENGKKPDFQEFLFIGNGKTFKESVKINKKAYKIMKKLLKAKKRNDEGAWETNNTDEGVLTLMQKTREILKNKYNLNVDIGIDAASSSFYNKGHYIYGNSKDKRDEKAQIEYIKDLIEIFKILYIEDPLQENDFLGFARLKKEINKKAECLIVGDDLTTTNPERLNLAIKNKSINAIIVKPNQIGSLIKVKKVIEIAKKHNIKTIISHRSGETKDDTIADLCIGLGCDFIKTGVHGRVREIKLKRLIKIEKLMNKK